jgi:hypothetical protein
LTKREKLPAQSRRFIEAARELGTDDDPERFKDTVRKVAKAPPKRNEPSKSKKTKP